MTRTLRLLPLLFPAFIFAQTPVPDLFLSVGGPEQVQGLATVVDDAGNVYVAGRFNGVADMDPAAGTFELTSNGDADVFILKLDRDGDFLWARRFGGTQLDLPTDMALTPEGDLLITGQFRETATFELGELPVTSNGNNDVFILKLAPDGDGMWAMGLGGTGVDAGHSITTDAAGNILLAGNFQDTMDFDPGPGEAPLTSFGNADAFVLKLSPAGGYLWAYRFGGFTVDNGEDVAVDASGNVFFTGNFQLFPTMTPDVGLGELQTNGGYDLFLFKFNAAGTFQWFLQLGDTGLDKGNALAIYPNGDIAICGEFSNTVDFDPGPGETLLTSGGTFRNAFIMRLTTDAVLVWAKALLTTEYSIPRGLVLDAAEQVHVSGYFAGIIDLDPGPGELPFTFQAVEDAFQLTLDASGDLVSGGVITGSSQTRLFKTALGPDGELWSTGWFQGTATTDFGPPGNTLTSAGSFDALLMRMDQCPPGATDVEVSGDGNTLAAQLVGASYQWIDCNTNEPIVGATDAAFSPGTFGSFAVQVGIGGCTATSDCYPVGTVGVGSAMRTHSLSVYPNPTSGLLVLRSDQAFQSGSAVLRDGTGRILRTYANLSGPETTLDVEGVAAGMLWLEVWEDGTAVARIRVVKQ